MRPLFFEEPENQKLYTYNTAYFWGKDFIVSPILNKGQKEQSIYFPKNSDWVNFYTDEKISGGTTQTFATEEDKIPTFVRAGSIIPMAKPMQSTKEYDGNSLILHYYFDEKVKETQLKLYNDDGLQNGAYEKGQFEMMNFEAKTNGKAITFELENEVGANFSAKSKNIELVIHHVSKNPNSIKAGCKKLEYTYDSEKKTLKVNLVWDSAKESKVKIKLQI